MKRLFTSGTGAEYKPEKSKEGFSYEDFDFRNSPYWKDPKGMIEKLHEKGKKLVLWQIPVFKGMEPDRTSEQLDLDKEYAIEHGLAVLNKDGTPYEIPEGNWFEGSYIPDFTNEKTREFWFRKRQYLTDIGVDGFKTDGRRVHLFQRCIIFRWNRWRRGQEPVLSGLYQCV